MANNRLYIIDRNSGKYICIAKKFETWQLGNIYLLDEFLNNDWTSISRLEIIEENNPNFLDKIKGLVNYNKENTWLNYNDYANE